MIFMILVLPFIVGVLSASSLLIEVGEVDIVMWFASCSSSSVGNGM